jgi:hypothetical protein
MGWFKSKFKSWIFDEESKAQVNRSKDRLSVATNEVEFDTPIRFSITPARGGIVVTSRMYDRQKDRHHEIIHVIHDDEDVARKVGDIVALELMKA